MLKGADAAVLATAQQLQLETQIEPVWKGHDCGYCEREETGEDIYCSCSRCTKALHELGMVNANFAVGGKLEVYVGGESSCDCWSGDVQCELPKSFNARSVSTVHWVQIDFRFQLALVSMGWGNEPCLNTLYSAAAIILKIPEVSARFSTPKAID